MKKIVLCLVALSLTIVTSCSSYNETKIQDNETKIQELKNDKLSADNFFETIISKKLQGTNNENVFYISFDYNNRNKSILITDITEKEPAFFVLEDTKLNYRSTEDSFSYAADSYKVTCVKGGKDLWTKTCDGKYSCGGMIYDCLNQVGCVETCKSTAVYMPQINTFYLID